MEQARPHTEPIIAATMNRQLSFTSAFQFSSLQSIAETADEIRLFTPNQASRGNKVVGIFF